jgi:hypothetical protein
MTYINFPKLQNDTYHNTVAEDLRKTPDWNFQILHPLFKLKIVQEQVYAEMKGMTSNLTQNIFIA